MLGSSRSTVLVLLGVMTSCVRDKPTDAPRPIATVSAAPVGSTEAPKSEPPLEGGTRVPIEAECEPGSMPEAEMIADNIAATEVSGVGEIITASAEALDGSQPPPTKGYMNFRYEVRVLKHFAGQARERLVLYQGVEAGAKLRPIGSLLFFSACWSKGKPGAASEPDVAYFFPVESECMGELERAAAAAPKRSGGATACQPP